MARIETEARNPQNLVQLSKSAESGNTLQNPLKKNTLPLSQDEEVILISKARKGDGMAFSAIYEVYAPRVFSYYSQRVGSLEVAEDLTSDVFINIIQKLPEFEFRGIPFSAWVLRIAHNKLVSFWRSRREAGDGSLLEVVPSQDESSNPQVVVEKKMLVEQILAVAETLPEFQKEIFRARFLEGLSVQETAQKLRKSENSVKVGQSRAFLNLRAILSQDGFKDLIGFVERKPMSTTVVERIRRVSRDKLDRLPPYLRIIADLIRSGKTIEEAAQTSGKRVDRVYSNLFLALSRLGKTKPRINAKKVE